MLRAAPGFSSSPGRESIQATYTQAGNAIGFQAVRAEVKQMGKILGKSVLLIENDPEQTRIIRAMFDDQAGCSFALTHVRCLADAETDLAGHPVDIVLLDLGLSDPETVRRARALAPHASIVLLSSLLDEPTAIQAIRVEWTPKLRQANKTHFSANGEWCHGSESTEVHAGV